MFIAHIAVHLRHIFQGVGNGVHSRTKSATTRRDTSLFTRVISAVALMNTFIISLKTSPCIFFHRK